ncbi:hypothetical protein J4G33_09675 [Actinotalea sp. BY-33]|uniref:Uncharacterized protein n=1 Tax=Actinotalea soli TaxID=2819234 RepID=A0A939LPR3_9CELL|nr:hypothetical protein [Actinotalea soli]MBO1752071.1 hypothetical protein [Actinotalea soli]
MSLDQSTTPSVARRHGVRSLARGLAVVAAALAVADLFRWGNRWYVSTQFAASDEAYASQLLASAHAPLVSAVVWVLVATAATAIGWRLRVVRARG